MKLFSFFNTSYTFEGKKDDEQVCMYLHRSWYTVLSKIVIILLAMLIPFVVIVLFGQILQSYNLIPLFAFFWSCYYLVLWFMVFYILTMYNLNSWIITNTRIIEEKQLGFFSQEVSELDIVNIQDVSFTMDGFVATMVGYGDVEVETAGHDTKFVFREVSDPKKVKDQIMQLAQSMKGENGVNLLREIGRQVGEMKMNQDDQNNQNKLTDQNKNAAITATNVQEAIKENGVDTPEQAA